MMTGTFVSSLGGDTPRVFMGLNFWAVQYTTLMRAFVMLALSIVLIKYWKSFTRNEDIRMIEIQKEELRIRKLRAEATGQKRRFSFRKA